MGAGSNYWTDVSGIANSILEDAVFIVRNQAIMGGLVRTFNDRNGMNPRIGHIFSTAGTAVYPLAETVDLASQQLTPAVLSTLTPAEFGALYFVSDQRAESDAPENIVRDAAKDLAAIAVSTVETALYADLQSLTGGTVPASGLGGTAITWGYLAAAIAQAQNANKSMSAPVSCVMHGYTWATLAKTASIAGASFGSGLGDEVNRTGLVAKFMNVPILQSFVEAAGTACHGGVFPPDAIALDWRRSIRIVPQRDESKRGTEYVMSGVFAHGVWQPSLGVQFVFSGATPLS